MSRWHLLTACSITSTLLGCASSFTPGLASVPQLGGSPVADGRPTEVVANGRDACRAGAGGSVLRGKYPPCPTVERSAFAPVTIVIHDPTADALVSSWVKHFYEDWPCHGPRPEDAQVLALLGPAPATLCKP
ncbi:MAG TPA: hypothetical protein VIF09_09460 [Polyangiaceae bacterium]|jgi:hypothetical protein